MMADDDLIGSSDAFLIDDIAIPRAEERTFELEPTGRLRVRLQRCAVLQATDLSEQEMWWRLSRIAVDLVPSALRELFRVRWREQYGVTWEDGAAMGGIFVAGGLIGPCTVPVPGDLSFKSGNKLELPEFGCDMWLGRVQDDGTRINGVRAGDKLCLRSRNPAAADCDATVKCVVPPTLQCPGNVKFKDKLPKDYATIAACIMQANTSVAESVVIVGKKNEDTVTSADDCITQAKAGDIIQLRLEGSDDLFTSVITSVSAPVPADGIPGKVAFKNKLPNDYDTTVARIMRAELPPVAEFEVISGKKGKAIVYSVDDCITQGRAGDIVQLRPEGSDDLFTSVIKSTSAADTSKGMKKGWLELNEHGVGAAGEKLSAFRCDEKGRVPAAKMRGGVGIDDTAKRKFGAGQLSEWDTGTCIKALIGMDPPLVDKDDDLGKVIDRTRDWRNNQVAHRGSTVVTSTQFGKARDIASALFSSIDTVVPSGNCTMKAINCQLRELSAPAATRPVAREEVATMQERFEQQNEEIARDLHTEEEQLDADICYEEEQAELKAALAVSSAALAVSSAALAVSSRRYEEETSQRRLRDLRRRKAQVEAARSAQRINAEAYA
jgi:hypothetical protein